MVRAMGSMVDPDGQETQFVRRVGPLDGAAMTPSKAVEEAFFTPEQKAAMAWFQTPVDPWNEAEKQGRVLAVLVSELVAKIDRLRSEVEPAKTGEAVRRECPGRYDGNWCAEGALGEGTCEFCGEDLPAATPSALEAARGENADALRIQGALWALDWARRRLSQSDHMAGIPELEDIELTEQFSPDFDTWLAAAEKAQEAAK
jgi:hypothetical protein